MEITCRFETGEEDEVNYTLELETEDQVFKGDFGTKSEWDHHAVEMMDNDLGEHSEVFWKAFGIAKRIAEDYVPEGREEQGDSLPELEEEFKRACYNVKLTV